MVASYNNNEDAPHEPDGVALVWNMKFKKTTPEYVFHCQVRKAEEAIDFMLDKTIYYMVHIPTVYRKKLKLKIVIFSKSTSDSPVFLEDKQPVFSNKSLSGLHVILCLFKTVPRRFSS